VIPLGPGASHAIAADPGSGTVLVDVPDGPGLLAFDAEGVPRGKVIPDDGVGDLVVDTATGLFWVTLPARKQLAVIDPVTLTVRRYDVPPETGCPWRLTTAAGLVVFISPYRVDEWGCDEVDSYHALDPQTGEVFPDLATVPFGYPYALASAGDDVLYAAERDSNDVLASYRVSRTPTPGLELTARRIARDGSSNGTYWVRDLTATPDTGRVLVGGSVPGYQVITPSLDYDPVQPEGMSVLQVYVAAGAGFTAYSPWSYGSSPGIEDLTVYRTGDPRPAAQYAFGHWGDDSDSDAVDGLAIGRHLYAVTEFGVPASAYLRVIPLPASSAPPPEPDVSSSPAPAPRHDAVWVPGPGVVRHLNGPHGHAV
jgi:hypothetical protein